MVEKFNYNISYISPFKALNKANKQHRKRNIKQVTNGNVTCFYYWKNGGIHMRITTYKTELNSDNLNTLVKEKSCNCTGVETLNNPSLIAEMFNVVFRLDKQTEEYLYMLALTTKGKPLGVFEISHGMVNMTICNPREIFIKALLCGASGIIITHNHPSGDTTPSKEDIKSYNRLKEAGKLIGINVLDSIIVGDSYYSFAENGI